MTSEMKSFSLRSCFKFRLATLFWVAAVIGCLAAWRRDRNALVESHETKLWQQEQVLQKQEWTHRKEVQTLREDARMRLEGLFHRAPVRAGSKPVAVRFCPSEELALSYGAKIIDEETLLIDTAWSGSDIDILHLLAFDKLLNLHLVDAPVTREAIYYVAYLRNLKELQLHIEQADTKSLKYIWDLPRLEVLHLSGQKINDETIKQLRHLKKLRYLFLTDTAVTPTALRRFKTLNPRLVVFQE